MSGFRFVGVIALALAFTGCETVDLNQYMSRSNTVGAGQSANAAPDASVREQANVRQALIDPTHIPTTDELLTSNPEQVRGLIGAPSLTRAEETAEVWQYATDACVLFLFFYPDEAGDARVSYVTSSGVHQGQQTPGDQQCVAAVTHAAANGLVAS